MANNSTSSPVTDGEDGLSLTDVRFEVPVPNAIADAVRTACKDKCSWKKFYPVALAFGVLLLRQHSAMEKPALSSIPELSLADLSDALPDPILPHLAKLGIHTLAALSQQTTDHLLTNDMDVEDILRIQVFLEKYELTLKLQ